MRLTKTDKEAFVRAVMDDVPKHDFDEMAKLMVIGHFKKVLPKEIVAILDDKKLRGYIDSNYVGMPREIDGFYTRYRPLGFQGWGHLPNDVKIRLEELCTFKEEQTAKRDALRSQVTGMIEPVTTLKAALAKLPEFAKYLPAEREVTGTVNLPVANVVAELNKAGWPKKEKANGKKAAA